jgi:hypothetical protein
MGVGELTMTNRVHTWGEDDEPQHQQITVQPAPTTQTQDGSHHMIQTQRSHCTKCTQHTGDRPPGRASAPEPRHLSEDTQGVTCLLHKRLSEPHAKGKKIGASATKLLYVELTISPLPQHPHHPAGTNSSEFGPAREWGSTCWAVDSRARC